MPLRSVARFTSRFSCRHPSASEKACSRSSRARCIFTPSARSIRPRISDSATGSPFAARKWRLRSSDRKAMTSASATSAASGPDSTGAASNAYRTHSARRNPAPRARSSSKANSASLTLVPTDFVRSGGFMLHRQRGIFRERTHARRALLNIGQRGRKRAQGLKLMWFPNSNLRSPLG